MKQTVLFIGCLLLCNVSIKKNIFVMKSKKQLWMNTQEYESNPMKFEVNGDLL